MRCDEVRDFADAYGLGALDPSERESADRHAEGCAACRQLLDEACIAASAVALATPLYRAPRDLYAAVMRQVTVDSDRSPRPAPLRRIQGRTSEPELTPAQAYRPMQGNHGPSWWSWKQGIVASLAAVLLLGAAFWIVGLQMQVNRLQTRSQTLQRGLSDFEGQRAALMLLASDGTSRFPMEPTDTEITATGAVIWNRSQKRCSVFAAGLPSVAQGQAYHVWL